MNLHWDLDDKTNVTKKHRDHYYWREAFEGFVRAIKPFACLNRNQYALLWHVWCLHGALYSSVILIQYSHTAKTSIHYNDAIMSAMASQITGVSIVCSTGCSGADQRKHQSSASLAFVRGIHRWPVDSPPQRPVTRKMFPFDDVIMPDCKGRQIDASKTSIRHFWHRIDV